MSQPRPCQRCERVRPVHAYGWCNPCYVTLKRRGWLPTRLPAGYFPCQRCGVVPRTLRYRRQSNYRIVHGLCHPCQQRDYRQRVKARQQSALEQAS